MSSQDTAGTARGEMTMDTSETTRLRALLERAALPACEAGRDRGDNLCVYQTGRHQWTVAEVSDSPDASADAIEARAELFAAIPTALPGLLDRVERAERERDDLAATLETRTAEHALAMARVRELEAERDAWRRTAESGSVSLADLKVIGEGAALVARRTRAEVMRLRAMIASNSAIITGRTTPPTDAEIEAHWRAGGTWVVEGVIVLRSAEAARSHRDQTSWAAVPWVPMRDGRPCAWPEVSRG